MRDPFEEPFSQPEDLGCAVPDSEHAVSMCLPTWESVIGYEERSSDVMESLECGYPRFVPHPMVAELFEAAEKEFAKHNETALVYPSLAAAWRAAEFVKKETGKGGKIESYGWEDLTVLVLPESSYQAGWKYWQHSGEIISSRQAESALADAPVTDEVVGAGLEALQRIRERIAATHAPVEVSPQDVFLFSCGMGAIAAVHRILTSWRKEAPTLQFEFPYIDSYKIQEKFGGGGVVDFTSTETGGAAELREFLASGGTAAAAYTELPSNPLLRTVDLNTLTPLLKEHGIPWVIDDTIATSVNVAPLRFADIVTTSLTKMFSGEGDVAGGSVVVHPQSPWAAELREALAIAEQANPLFSRDAMVLEVNSRHFAERVRASSDNALEIATWLATRLEISYVAHPSLITRDHYDQVRRDHGGYGGLLSFGLHGGPAVSAAFYDQLDISKGPSLGTNFSLISPYTMLAHYDELDWAAQRGVPSDLLRLWVGLEEPDDLIERLADAINKIA